MFKQKINPFPISQSIFNSSFSDRCGEAEGEEGHPESCVYSMPDTNKLSTGIRNAAPHATLQRPSHWPAFVDGETESSKGHTVCGWLSEDQNLHRSVVKNLEKNKTRSNVTEKISTYVTPSNHTTPILILCSLLSVERYCNQLSNHPLAQLQCSLNVPAATYVPAPPFPEFLGALLIQMQTLTGTH